MKDNFCPSSEISEIEYSTSQKEIGIYEIEFENKKENPWKEYKYFCRVGGGWRGFSSIREARKFWKEDF